MSHEAKIHEAQIAILRELLFQPSAGYAQLQRPTGLASDHFNFHIGRLIDLGYVEKMTKGHYKLSQKGKEYANKLDTDAHTIERQPKVAVILAVQHRNGRWLFQERLKNPYFGFWGFPSGKIRWGETIKETAARELDEETGLTADLRISGLYHEIVRSAETDEILEDKQFFVVHCTNPKGVLKESFEGGRNAWCDTDEVLGKLPHFDSVEIEIDLNLGKYCGEDIFIERTTRYSKEQF